MLTDSSAILAAFDVAETVKFYKEVLGFTSSWTYGDPPTFAGVSWGKFTIMFGQNQELAKRVEGHGQWLQVDDVDALHASHLEKGAMIVSPMEDKPWGRREYTVRDLNGYHLRFGGDITHTPRGSGVLPADIQILRRMPTIEEYATIAGAAFYRNGVDVGILEHTWAGVVAIKAAGEAVGTLRIMKDAPGWFSLWDVAVLPEWQGQRIGTAMMEAALAMVCDACSNANVYLFTYKHQFYERLGFAKESVDLIKL